jgi:hypothetical protein
LGRCAAKSDAQIIIIFEKFSSGPNWRLYKLGGL